ncbi:MAG TPA: NAD(P)/FAD-dependent oxidoreductase [Thermoleophilaceae bacterium]|jgi:cation diffusion facilitator CzcD-associated flavoprotein CzcO
MGNGSRRQGPSVAIVGAGFGGIGLGIKLQQAGIESFTIFEKAGAVGGVWRDNSYPGLTCDVPSHLYQFSFEPNHDWTRRFPQRDEILAYLERLTDKHGLREHMRLGTEVAAADFDAERGRWVLRLVGGEEAEFDVLVTATGQLSRPSFPRIPGLDDFRGELFHSARWNHDYDMAGKRVAAIGTGASAVQYVPEVAKVVERLHVFQRTPGWVIPKPDRPYRPREKALFRRIPLIPAISRRLTFIRFELFTLAMTRAYWMLRLYELGYKRRLRTEIPDPQLREKLVPGYPMGCKRVLISNDYLPALARPNVEVVTDDIHEVTATGVATADGRVREVDAIVLGTGFQANEFLAPMAIRGRDGADLNDVWRDGAEAYLGLAISGFPNMFMLYGPNTNLGAGSIITMLESQIGFVVEAVRDLGSSGARWMDVRGDVQSAFNREVQERLGDSVWAAGCNSWYRTESGRVTNNWAGFVTEYKRRTRRPDPADFVLA